MSTLNWTDENWDCKGTRFAIRKLLPMPAFSTLEIVRVSIGSKLADVDFGKLTTADAEDTGMQLQMFQQLFTIIMQTPIKVVAELQRRMFAEVFYTNSLATTPRAVGGNEAEAFIGLSPIDVYQLTARCFMVNFFDCFSELLSLLPAAAQDIPPPSTET